MNDETDYDYLEDSGVVLEIINPDGNENLFIELAEEFTISFSAWHSHYCTYAYDYEEMKKNALAIINGRYAALNFEVEDEWMGSMLLKEEISHFTEPEYLISKMDFPDDILDKINNDGVTITADYWRTSDCYEFNVPSKQSCEEYSFPRRYSIRFILKDGKCCGSGAIKKYDDETAYLQYIYVEKEIVTDIDDVYKLQVAVIEHLEADAKKMGLIKIFSNIENIDEDLFLSLGYKETGKIDNARVEKLNGAKVIFDKTVIKCI